MQAMILAAGFGIRLLPHTAIRPKPLFPILNRPLLLIIIERLLSAGFDHIIINCHHLAGQIEEAVCNIPQVVLQKEEVILGTGGGLQRAWSSGLLHDEPLLISNSDIYHTLDLRSFYNSYRTSYKKNPAINAVLAMHDYPRFNSVYCTEKEVAFFSDDDNIKDKKKLAFTGIHCIQPHILEQAEEGFSSIIDLYKKMLANGETIACYRADYRDDFYWRDIGTEKDYLQLHSELLQRKIPLPVGLLEKKTKILCETNDNGAIFIDWAVVGKAILGKECAIARSVIWDGVKVPDGSACQDRLLSEDYTIEKFPAIDIAKKLLKEAGKTIDDEPLPVSPDGSSRRFWRLSDTIVAAPPAECTAQDMAEAKAVWHIGSHLYRKGCATPQLYDFYEKSGVVLMEDMGSTSLYSIASYASDAKRLALYKKVIEKLVYMQVYGGEDFNTEWCCGAKEYTTAVMIEKESHYFLRAFWQGIVKREIPDGIQEEFQKIAEMAAEAPADLFQHRDCQSRNIMIKENSPYFIDFQGGVLGAAGYDLASLLIDPYVSLSSALQKELLSCYLDEMEKVTGKRERSQFIHCYNALAVQRNLQIIGAFSFLTTVKKKLFFAQYIKKSLVMLKERLDTKQFVDFPILKETVQTSIELI